MTTARIITGSIATFYFHKCQTPDPAETVKRRIEQVIPPAEQRKEKSKAHDISLWSSRLCAIISMSLIVAN